MGGEGGGMDRETRWNRIKEGMEKGKRRNKRDKSGSVIKYVWPMSSNFLTSLNKIQKCSSKYASKVPL